ncbi:hypothetical protein CRE_16121 [Caenorhabditis remanei]|uniref:C2H2-type domain-containing protein n=1 Tax=Caenorhabditis remanei TaxID=31234 RepID=E3MBX9_CAERE|nr:hypothetical protein CRE_16121 [Caenorhabditis remanei]
MTKLTKESEKPPDFTCNSCGEICCSLASLHRHRDNRYHTSRKCLLCNLFLSKKENSKNHLVHAHNIQKPMTCRCCDWIFLSNMEYCHHRMFLKGTRTDSSYPLILNECPPGFYYGEESKWLDESKEILVKWQMGKLNEEIPSTSKISTPSSSDTVSPALRSRAPAKKKGFMIKDILGWG